MCEPWHVELALLSGPSITQLMTNIDEYYTGSLRLGHYRCKVDEGIPVCRKLSYLICFFPFQ